MHDKVQICKSLMQYSFHSHKVISVKYNITPESAVQFEEPREQTFHLQDRQQPQSVSEAPCDDDYDYGKNTVSIQSAADSVAKCIEYLVLPTIDFNKKSSKLQAINYLSE